jgi:hypothetical protein
MREPTVEIADVVTKTGILRCLCPRSWILEFDGTRLPPREFCISQRVASRVLKDLILFLAEGALLDFVWFALN